MLFPHHDIVVCQFIDSGIRQFHRTRKSVRYNAQTSWTECLGFWNHAPKQAGSHILFQILGIVRHGHQFNRVCMQRSSVRRAFTQQVVVYTKVGWQLGSRLYRIIGNDDIRSTIIQNADYGAVFHRPTGQVTHTTVIALAEEIASLQVRQSSTDWINFTDGRHLTDFIIHPFGNVDGNVTTITFCPTFFPQISSCFGYLIYFTCQCRTII